jgi:hypothetical protein
VVNGAEFVGGGPEVNGGPGMPSNATVQFPIYGPGSNGPVSGCTTIAGDISRTTRPKFLIPLPSPMLTAAASYVNRHLRPGKLVLTSIVLARRGPVTDRSCFRF